MTFDYVATLEKQITHLENVNDELAKRISDKQWTHQSDVPRLAECLMRNVGMIENLATKIKDYLEKPTARQSSGKKGPK